MNYENLKCTRSDVTGMGMCKERVKYIVNFRSGNDTDYYGDPHDIVAYPRCHKHMLEDRDFAVNVELIDPKLLSMK